MKRLYLLRHGLTRGNLEHLYYGSTDLPLCEEGLRQLAALRRQGGYPSPDGMLAVTSGMLRTEQTLAALYGDIPHERWPELCEMNFGAFEMHSYDELKDRADYQSWLSGDMAENHTPGGESEREVHARVLTRSRDYRRRNGMCLPWYTAARSSISCRHFFPAQEKTGMNGSQNRVLVMKLT